MLDDESSSETANTSLHSVSYDTILQQMGNGRWQWNILAILCIVAITSGLSHNSVRILDNFHGGFIRNDHLI